MNAGSGGKIKSLRLFVVDPVDFVLDSDSVFFLCITAGLICFSYSLAFCIVGCPGVFFDAPEGVVAGVMLFWGRCG